MISVDQPLPFASPPTCFGPGSIHPFFDVVYRITLLLVDTFTQSGEQSRTKFGAAMQRLLIACALFVILPVQADAVKGTDVRVVEVTARIVEYGIYYTRADTTVEAPETTTGEITLLNEPVHVRTATSIPALRGSTFGLRYKIDGLPEDAAMQVTDVIITPGLKNPNADEPMIYTETQMDVARGGRSIFTGYTFDDAWEAVAGEWTIEVWAGNSQLLSKKFTVFEAKPFRN